MIAVTATAWYGNSGIPPPPSLLDELDVVVKLVLLADVELVVLVDG